MEPATFLLVASFLVSVPLTKRVFTEPAVEYSLITPMVDTTHTVQNALARHDTEMIATDKPALLMSAIQQEISNFAQLVDDWDGEGAKAPSMETIISASLIARYVGFKTPAKPMVSASGSISLYWDLAGGYAELGVDELQNCYFFTRAVNSRETFLENLKIADVASQDWLGEHLNIVAAVPA